MSQAATAPAAATSRDPVPPTRASLWWRSLRAPSLLSSVVPASAGALAAIGTHDPDFWLGAVALLALLCLHAGTNISNDVEDAARGIDPVDKVRRNSRVFNTGALSITEGRRLYGSCFVTGALLGVGIAVVQGPAVLVIGLIGLLGGLCYTAGPRPYKYAGLGEAAIVLLMGPLMSEGVYTAVTGTAFSAAGFWVGIGPGLLIAGVLASNNLDDFDDDRAAGARTLAVRIGFTRARRVYATTLLAVIPAEVALWAGGVFGPWILAPLLVAPLLVARAREVLSMRAPGDPRLASLTPRTGVAHLLFSVLLCLSVLADRLL